MTTTTDTPTSEAQALNVGKFTISIDTSAIDLAQAKADKLKATLEAIAVLQGQLSVEASPPLLAEMQKQTALLEAQLALARRVISPMGDAVSTRENLSSHTKFSGSREVGAITELDPNLKLTE